MIKQYILKNNILFLFYKILKYINILFIFYKGPEKKYSFLGMSYIQTNKYMLPLITEKSYTFSSYYPFLFFNRSFWFLFNFINWLDNRLLKPKIFFKLLKNTNYTTRETIFPRKLRKIRVILYHLYFLKRIYFIKMYFYLYLILLLNFSLILYCFFIKLLTIYGLITSFIFSCIFFFNPIFLHFYIESYYYYFRRFRLKLLLLYLKNIEINSDFYFLPGKPLLNMGNVENDLIFVYKKLKNFIHNKIFINLKLNLQNLTFSNSVAEYLNVKTNKNTFNYFYLFFYTYNWLLLPFYDKNLNLKNDNFLFFKNFYFRRFYLKQRLNFFSFYFGIYILNFFSFRNKINKFFVKLLNFGLITQTSKFNFFIYFFFKKHILYKKYMLHNDINQNLFFFHLFDYVYLERINNFYLYGQVDFNKYLALIKNEINIAIMEKYLYKLKKTNLLLLSLIFLNFTNQNKSDLQHIIYLQYKNLIKNTSLKLNFNELNDLSHFNNKNFKFLFKKFSNIRRLYLLSLVRDEFSLNDFKKKNLSYEKTKTFENIYGFNFY